MNYETTFIHNGALSFFPGKIVRLEIVRQRPIRDVLLASRKTVRMDGLEVQPQRQEHSADNGRERDATDRCLPWSASPDFCRPHEQQGVADRGLLQPGLQVRLLGFVRRADSCLGFGERVQGVCPQRRPCRTRTMCPVQPQLHDDGLGLLAFEHVAAQPVRLSSSQDTILYCILLLILDQTKMYMLLLLKKRI